MKLLVPIFLLLVTALQSFTPIVEVRAEDPFAANIRPTEHLTPDQEQKSFRLPEGFSIHLVASEPQINKPLNMAFDAKGRLWVTDTIEYPYPAPKDRPGRDTIKILEDTDGDGQADHVTTFADGLNIPIGLYPYEGGCVVFSIPNIWHLKDTDGDGKADERTVLYGPMGVDRDTHGMNNAFRRGFDGWLYACHGFSNETTVKGSDGHTVHMQSGNTYRMRLDGSRVEHFTWGQVNPFGMTFDPLGNLFTADCHSMPIYQLLRGGYYPSFGKPHDGLGFVAPMMGHGHGSTAISGIAFYTGENFPESFRGNIFTGNVMTSRVNRDSLVYHGSTIIAQEEPDFVVTTDPWFRPVDIQLGPDDALYVADFYNRIIGHYEVPLDHPGRDRTSGRIWRITYRGKDSTSKPPRQIPDLHSASVNELIATLSDPNLTRRNLATDQLVDRIGAASVDSIRTAFHDATDAHTRLHALWALHRLNAASPREFTSAARDMSRDVRVHAMKVLSETKMWSPAEYDLALAALSDSDAFVARAAADALGQHPRYENVRALLDTLSTASPEDNHLIHTIRMALRDQLRNADNFQRLSMTDLKPADAQAVAGVSVSLPSPEAAMYLLRYVQKYSGEPASVSEYLQHVARYVPVDQTDNLAKVTREKFRSDIDFQLSLLSSIRRGLEQRGVAPSSTLKEWGEALVTNLLNSTQTGSLTWINTPLEGKPNQENPWVLQPRTSSDGVADALFLCSLPRGERLTGDLRSSSFTIPEKLSFFIAGHDGVPERPARGRNIVRLRDAQTHKILAEAATPRNDVAQKITWELKPHSGQKGYIEIIDGDEDRGFAWLAVGRFEPDVVSLPSLDPSVTTNRVRGAAEIVASLGLETQQDVLKKLLVSGNADALSSEAIGRALLHFQPDSRVESLVSIVGDASISSESRRAICEATANRNSGNIEKTLENSFRTVPARLQERLAQTLAGDKTGAEMLLKLVKAGIAPPHLLLSPAVADRLRALNLPDGEKRIAALTAAIPSRNEELAKLIEIRRAGYSRAKPSLERGAELFNKHCAACHQVDGKGALIAPQLDGIGNRGLERLLEDVLDPNRNIDAAFHVTTLVMDSGKVLSGLFRREEGATLVLVDNQGKEFTVTTADVEERKKSPTSLMPANVSEIMKEDEFYDVVAFLLSKRGNAATAEADTSKVPKP